VELIFFSFDVDRSAPFLGDIRIGQDQPALRDRRITDVENAAVAKLIIKLMRFSLADSLHPGYRLRLGIAWAVIAALRIEAV
jgi:hypothetical protein